MLKIKEIWNDRYRVDEYIYGELPNVFFGQSLDKYNCRGKLLLPAEGEGRNAVYAAGCDFDVTAFDVSAVGKVKALSLAKSHEVNFEYHVGAFLEMDFELASFDVVGLIFAHFSPNISAEYYQKISALTKPGGLIILEGFSEKNLALREKNPKIGGPNQLEMLFSAEKIKNYFPDFEILELEEVKTSLEEGTHHNGMARVIRFVGRKRGHEN